MAINILIVALMMDFFFGEPKRFHPLVGLGIFADTVENRLNKPGTSRMPGLIALGVVVVPLCLLANILEAALIAMPIISFLLSALILYLAIGWKSLLEHAEAVRLPLQNENIKVARQQVSYIVSRDTASLTPEGVSAAATESVLENGSDAIFAPIFWFLLGGLPAVVLYRIVNTLDAMWGYKNPHFFYFGWGAAKLDDLLNWVPARICALTYALCGHSNAAFKCWHEQAGDWKSPSAGPVMASGAGAINVKLGGVAHYHGDSQVRPPLGCGDTASYKSIQQAEKLVNRSLFLWVSILFIGSVFL
ncbi:MAG: cobalamin biosynthesis protein [Pseudomonadales bacterium]|nr:cobalamin biosynthesis protein [Pseudomonadales bacterium]